MINLPLIAEPNQSFSATLDGLNYDITLKACNGIMAATVVRQNVEIVSNARVLPFLPIIPYAYLAGQGNLFLSTMNDEMPAYEQFEVTQFMYYLSAAELEALAA